MDVLWSPRRTEHLMGLEMSLLRRWDLEVSESDCCFSLAGNWILMGKKSRIMLCDGYGFEELSPALILCSRARSEEEESHCLWKVGVTITAK
ncbi:hypothetical protein U1Q18_018258 [Sarracenia purpurea var. burkii]